MHIQQVIICGFRSYKDQIVVEPFSKQHNVVIGRNGTGKSNFFDAIRFGLLTSRFANLRQEERQSLLHEGAGKHVLSAYVEIIFNNEDGRLPIETDTVVLRRTIGVKKDEFFLNRKHITKHEVIQVLESAGFSRSNPYYIVQQGKVNALAVMKDADRLELLKEVAGTKVYEDRRLESLKIMHDMQSQRSKIDQVICYIEERLGELEEEKDELKQYQALDKSKRALEYTIYEKELQNVRLELEQIEATRMAEATKSSALRQDTQTLHERIGKIDGLLSDKIKCLQRVKERQTEVDADRQEALTRKCTLELQIDELRQEEAMRVKLDSEKQHLRVEIAHVTQTLTDTLKPALQAKQDTLDTVSHELRELQTNFDSLQAKKNRKNQFQSQTERDAYLTAEIGDKQQLCALKEQEITLLTSQVEEISQQSLHTRLNEQQSMLSECKDALTQSSTMIQTLKAQRNEFSEERKLRWKEERDLSQEVEVLTAKCSKAQDSMFAPDVRRALEVIHSLNVTGVYGPLIELIEPHDERFNTVIDEAGGGSLFHVVVDTDRTAAMCMKELDKRRVGRVTFLPLNRLKVSPVTYVRNDDIFPLIDKLTYNAAVEKAVLITFGKKLICRDLPTCEQYAQQLNMDCLTLQGDTVFRRGGLNGGFKDPKRSRMKAMGTVRAVQSRVTEGRTSLAKVRAVVDDLEMKVSRVLSELEKQKKIRQEIVDKFEQFQSEQKVLAKKAQSMEKKKEMKATQLHTAKSILDEQRLLIGTLEQELASTMQDALSKAEKKKMQQYLTEMKAKTGIQNKCAKQVEKARLEVLKLDTVLHENLLKRLNEMEESPIDGTSALAMKQEDLKRIVAQLKKLTNSSETEQMALEQDMQTLTAERDEVIANDALLNDQLIKETGRIEAILTRRTRCVEKRTDLMHSIRELGTLPKVQQPLTGSIASLKKKLSACTKEFSKYEHVNKKAFDQYVSFNTRRDELLKRQVELRDADTSIHDLIDVLDKKKDEAILRTFKGVSHHFSQVFTELVPTGNGRMCILKSSQPEEEEQVETFTGIQIKVNFRGEGEGYLMQQLSGGQKALVALAFIFAIQRCDPAPFYLFDEIDQALDSTHRAAVAALIHRQAHAQENQAQFITSTFRPEMVQVSDQFYGIGHQNTISNIHIMNKEESLEFIANIMAEEEGTDVS